MIIGCVGFSWSGSSAVTDLLMEYSENQVFRKEFIFAYHPDSLSDLDFHLNDECSKFLSSTVAIPRFKKVAKLLLKKDTKGKIVPLTNEYINNLIQISWLGDCQGQILLHNHFYYDYFGQRIMARRIIPKISFSLTRKMRFYPLNEMHFSIKPNGFIEKTQEYTSNILKSMGFDLKKKIVLDQPFPGNTPSRTMRYFKNAKAIIVDRDPRDLYLIVKHIFKKDNFSIPVTNVDDFILYYRLLHSHLEQEKNNPNILYINFESLIYDYENTTRLIEKFLSLENHDKPKAFFDPNMSVRNTQLFKSLHLFEDDIAKIENSLKEFLFDFDIYNKPNCTASSFFDINPLIDERKYRHGKK